MFSKAGVRLKFALVGVFTVIMAVGLTTAAVLWLMAADLTSQANSLQDSKLRVLHELVSQRGQVALVNGKLQAGDHVINGNYEIVDQLQKLSGGVATIFMGETRVSTNVLKDDGSRAVGTTLQGPALETTVIRGQPYRGEVNILGAPYFAAYDPIKDASGKTIGVYFVGVRKSDFFHSFPTLITSAIGIGLVMAAACGGLMAWAVGRVMRDVVRLTLAADKISTGEGLAEPVDLERPDEIGELAHSVERLRVSMKAAIDRMERAAG